MENEKHHVQSFFSLGLILVILLTLTLITVLVTEINFGIFSVAVALVIASIKGFIVLAHFMHLKYEGLFLKLIVAMVFLLYGLVIVITFIDYLFR